MATDPPHGSIELDALWAVLDGETTPSFKHPAARIKMMRILLGCGPVDVLILRDEFAIRRERAGRGGYRSEFALPVVVDLKKRSAIVKVAHNAVARMPGSESPALGLDEQPDQIVWFVRSDDGLDVFTRAASPEMRPPPAPQPVPTHGPLALPKPYWSPYLSEYREFLGGASCPHCLTTSTRFRQLPDALKCDLCGLRFAAHSLRR